MSDINEIITESMNRAFNAGRETGKLLERQRVLGIARSIAHFEHENREWLAICDLEELANDEQNN